MHDIFHMAYLSLLVCTHGPGIKKQPIILHRNAHGQEHLFLYEHAHDMPGSRDKQKQIREISQIIG